MRRFWRISSKSLKKLSHKSFWLRHKRAGYFGMALIILLSVISYSFFFNTPKANAATVGSSSDSAALGSPAQRHEVISSNGTMVAFFNTGTQSVTGIAYAASTDNGTTWGSATQVTSNQTSNFSVAIDGSDNIYIVYASGAPSSIFIIKLTYSTGSWSIGGSNTVVAGTGVCTGNRKDSYTSPTVAINSTSVVAVMGADLADVGASCIALSSTNQAWYSSNLTSWSPASGTSSSGGGLPCALIADGSSFWGLCPGPLINQYNLFADTSGTGTWNIATSLSSVGSAVSMSYGLDALHFLYLSSSAGITYSSYSISSGTLSSSTALSASASDLVGQITADSQNLWAVWQSFVGSSSYNVVYKRFNGTSWDSSPTSITTDNLNNTSINVPERMPNTANVPILWQVGTASPYTIKSATFSTVGTVTDTGNQTGSLTGSLTGSSGDAVVKCGIWYYNTVNIVLGMTVKVCAGNGQTGGTLEIHANSITVAGAIDGVGRGSPGGVVIYGVGGAAGTAGVRLGAAATAGSAGTSSGGGPGSGSFGGSAGSAGTNDASPGSAGTGGHGGGGGGGTGATNGSSGTNGGYLTAGGNGDGTTDTSLVMGSGGGGGGGGGAGSGGGGGAAGVTGGNGGSGGQGGASLGGPGGDGGAIIKLYSTGSITISGSGSVSNTGVSGGSGVASNGSSGVTGTGSSPGAGGPGGTAPSGNGSSGVDGASTGGSGGGGGGASATGGIGGNGAGGGVLLKSTAGGSSITINGTINTSGGSSTTNGGTVKLFSCIEPSTSGITAGRIYANAPGGGANCPPSVPTLSFPVNSSNGNTVFTTFNLRSTDPDGDYLNYWIDVCADNLCSSIIRSICQINTGTGVPGTCTPSQTGWASQDQQAGTAYTGNPTLTLSTLAVHNYQPPLLSANTQYWWRAYAIDPGGSDTWSSASPISTFTTAPTETHIQGNIKIQGNVKL